MSSFRVCAHSRTVTSADRRPLAVDWKTFVSNRDAVVWTKKLLEDEGMFVGVSAGAIASICVRVAGELDEGNVVFVVLRRRLEVPELGRLHEDGRAAEPRGRPRDRLVLVMAAGG